MAANKNTRWIKGMLEESTQDMPIMPWQRAAKRARRTCDSMRMVAAQR